MTIETDVLQTPKTEDKENQERINALRNGIPVGKEVKPEDVLFHSARYNVLGEIGRGTWGVVYAVKDTLTQEYHAVKILCLTELARQQMARRNLTLEGMLVNEGGTFKASKHVVPRWLEEDKNGQLFIVMPLYTNSLEEKIRGLNVNNGLSQKQAINYLTDIAAGLSELSTEYNKCHGDLKLDNVLCDTEGHCAISDLGTATFGSIVTRATSPRDNMGCIFTRAPECFKDGSHPEKQSDAYSFASIACKLFTGHYLLEDELRNSKEPAKFFEQLGEEGINRLVRKQLSNKNIPRKLRRFLTKCARFSIYERPLDGKVLQSQFEETIENLSNWNMFTNYFRKWGLPVALAASILSFGIYNANTYEPRKLDMPQTKFKGLLYPTEAPREQRLRFESEEDTGWQDVQIVTGGMLVDGFARVAKQCTDHRGVAYLLKSYMQAHLSCPLDRGYNDEQFRIFIETTTHNERHIAGTGPVWPVVAKSIACALEESKSREGVIDLEDCMAIARLGTAKVSQAKRISKSRDYANYRNAKNEKGELIINKKEQEFIQYWLAYYNRDI